MKTNIYKDHFYKQIKEQHTGNYEEKIKPVNSMGRK